MSNIISLLTKESAIPTMLRMDNNPKFILLTQAEQAEKYALKP
ncbi:hypothetical protein ECDEC2B_5267 [Escherichia coli DEC2B]|uniref:Uncharacterized protein n=1 Tax=Escherichia coli DEC2D TaxID=868141 RepID=A0A828U5H6_ECOLX|nr:hypothetical protein EC236275_1367 [Escherichia coli 2362-75]EFW69420.1 hypothetical protein EcoM_02546 [Escherichia coli WV_060327]EFZ73697.1 hypothetical protein ECRN5871_3362 [Escherichia coli RN587/1]EHU07577.1 hypothetical protein ECDEC1C_3488 [Escherichia coli DEC1C]EHU07682.1 hypothetical protein ECDEC1A_2981 [Escherichia coli DEC1A]EHU11269.1 hypothetical protein ECDEC1B_3111 [Escherichia coli DEC1B]EHU20875.1 hypothetical protein ECDEC1D_3417 [Escherichia coli DEC1D]EHU24097.1 hy